MKAHLSLTLQLSAGTVTIVGEDLSMDALRELLTLCSVWTSQECDVALLSTLCEVAP